MTARKKNRRRPSSVVRVPFDNVVGTGGIYSFHNQREHIEHMLKRSKEVVAEAQKLQHMLEELAELGPAITWLGSRKFLSDTLEYTFSMEAACIFARKGLVQKTGGGFGVMESPHKGCVLAGRPKLAVGVRMEWLSTEELPNKYLQGGKHFDMPSFNSRHDGLFYGTLAHIILAGRLGTKHELMDLFNRLKHRRLLEQPVYLLERDGFYSELIKLLLVEIKTESGEDSFNSRISPEDVEKVKLIDISRVDSVEFAEMVLKDLGCQLVASAPAA